MADWLTYIGRRLIQFALVIFIAGSINFMIPRLIPGDPIESALARMSSQGGEVAIDADAIEAKWNARFGFDQPLPVQFVNYWQDLLRGDLGVSLLNFPQPVTERISAALPWSLGLLGVSTLIAFTLGSLAGALLVWPRSPRPTKWLVPPFLALSAIPYYLLAILLVYVFSITLGWFPSSGGFSPTQVLGPNLDTALDIAGRAFLPALSIVLGAVGFWALGMRSLTVNVLGEDFITYAESKGLSQKRIFLRYGMRNALLPQVTALALVLATVVSGAVLVEAIFNYPGLGGLLFTAITGNDIFVINGIVMVLIVTLALAVLVVDLLYPLIDPRITGKG